MRKQLFIAFSEFFRYYLRCNTSASGRSPYALIPAAAVGTVRCASTVEPLTEATSQVRVRESAAAVTLPTSIVVEVDDLSEENRRLSECEPHIALHHPSTSMPILPSSSPDVTTMYPKQERLFSCFALLSVDSVLYSACLKM
ncbi:unnamed protein product [Gongylonema pulchrum]|uniref:Uncharacterized protein n=1 Tax=Gongylonema pulchrum TaxID=637853 RepID=A0A183D1T7_9BILA|nr:unnamed protein product [Gongylonema pulchrum]